MDLGVATSGGGDIMSEVAALQAAVVDVANQLTAKLDVVGEQARQASIYGTLQV